MDEFVGPNDCSIPLDDIQLSCSVRYSGHKQPTLEWRKSGENEILRSHCVIENDSQFTCNVTLEPSLDFQGSSFTCQTTESSEKKQYSCTTKPIAILRKYIAASTTISPASLRISFGVQSINVVCINHHWRRQSAYHGRTGSDRDRSLVASTRAS